MSLPEFGCDDLPEDYRPAKKETSMKVLNGFSVSLLEDSDWAELKFSRMSVAAATNMLRYYGTVESFVGHQNTADMFSKILGMEIPCRRESARLAPKESAIVGQYKGPRLPEGATALPDGATFDWWLVTNASVRI